MATRADQLAFVILQFMAAPWTSPPVLPCHLSSVGFQHGLLRLIGYGLLRLVRVHGLPSQNVHFPENGTNMLTTKLRTRHVSQTALAWPTPPLLPYG